MQPFLLLLDPETHHSFMNTAADLKSKEELPVILNVRLWDSLITATCMQHMLHVWHVFSRANRSCLSFLFMSNLCATASSSPGKTFHFNVSACFTVLFLSGAQWPFDYNGFSAPVARPGSSLGEKLWLCLWLSCCFLFVCLFKLSSIRLWVCCVSVWSLRPQYVTKGIFFPVYLLHQSWTRAAPHLHPLCALIHLCLLVWAFWMSRSISAVTSQGSPLLI